MKRLPVFILAGLMILTTPIINSATTTPVIGVARTDGRDASGQKIERTVVVRDDGSFEAMDVENGVLVSGMSVHIKGDHIVIIKNTPWGVSTQLVDKADLDRYLKENPLAAREAKESLDRLISKQRSQGITISRVTPALRCAAQRQALVDAANYMDVACGAFGDPSSCARATSAYMNAYNAYNACMDAHVGD